MKICGLMREHGIENFVMQPLEECPCDNRRELLDREGYYQLLHRDTYGVPICNTRIEGMTIPQGQSVTQQWFRENPEAYQRHLDQQKERVTCEYCGVDICRGYSMKKHKETFTCRYKGFMRVWNANNPQLHN
jgi:hypothetical protein